MLMAISPQELIAVKSELKSALWIIPGGEIGLYRKIKGFTKKVYKTHVIIAKSIKQRDWKTGCGYI